MKRLLLALIVALLLSTSASAQVWNYRYFDDPYYHAPYNWDLGWPAQYRHQSYYYGYRPIGSYGNRCRHGHWGYGYGYWGW